MRYKVPQNIDMPDRIIGPLTMLQFVEAVLGGGLAYVCYNAFPKPINIFLAILAGIFTVAVVFVKVNERPFLYFFKSLVFFLVSPKRRVWQKGTDNGFDIEIYKPPQKQAQHIERKQLDKEKLSQIANEIDHSAIDKMRIDR